MDIVVCLKQIVDMKQIRIKRETRKPVLEGLPLLMGDMDRNALEEAVRLKEKEDGKVIALSAGSPKLKETIKDALAAGADEAFILADPLVGTLDSRRIAQVLAAAIRKIGRYDLILMGEGSTDNYSGQVGPRLAELLDLPAITYAKLVEHSGGMIRVTRHMEESLEVVEAGLPALVTVTSGINEPRIPALTQILRAGKKPLQEWALPDIGLSAGDLEKGDIKVVSNLAPVEERKKVIFEAALDENVDNLVNSLIKEGLLRG